MLKNNYFKQSISLIFLFLLLTGCSFFNNNVKPETNTVITLPPIVQRAETNFNKGKSLLLEGKIDESKYFFDRTIDVFIDAETNNKIIRKHLISYIDKIAKIELEYLKESNSINENIERDNAFLDEIISSPLFFPSKKDILNFKKIIKKTKPVFSIPIIITPRVVSFLKAFQNIKHNSIQRALNRSTRYIKQFRETFKKMGVPEDLAYLPIIESGFRIHAISRARANGMWQFMSATARMFNLKVNWVVDERRDPFKSSIAAAKLLKRLYKQYGSWYMALASYNGGTRRINRAIRKLKTKDFFKIAKSRYIKRETKNYVPAFLASIIIAKSPKEYGFTITQEVSDFDNTKIIKIPSPVDLKTIAKLSKVSYARLKKLNPELIRHFTPFNKKYYYLRVPSLLNEIVLSKLKRLPPQKKYFVGWYRIKRGDSLYSIARKYKTSVKKIKRVNKLRRNLIKPGRRLLIPRGR